MQGNSNGYRLNTEPLPPDQSVSVIDDLEIRQARQTIILRYVVTVVVLLLYALTLAATLTIFYLAGFGTLELADNVLISLSGVVIGELGVGAILMQIVKSIFT